MQTSNPESPHDSLTPQQRAAVFDRDVSISLSAGAGSGKTHVLTQRFLSHLDPTGPDAAKPLKLDELVAITFTDAAAREMRDRVRKACFARLDSAAPEQAEYWYRLVRSLDAARITTIHAFCSSLLRAHAVEAGVDPHFATLEENHASLLRRELVDDLFREKLAAKDETLLQLAHLWGVDGLRERILSLMSEGSAEGFANWSNASAEDLLDTWEQYAESSPFRDLLIRSVVDSPEAATILRILPIADVNNKTFHERREILLDGFAAIRDTTDWMEMFGAMRSASMVRGAGSVRQWPDPDMYKDYKSAGDTFRRRIDKVQKLTWNREAARPAAETALKLHALACAAVAKYNAEKTALSSLDFDDLIAAASALLDAPNHDDLRKQITRDVQVLLVDEFQDTDPRQAAIVEKVCGDAWTGGRLFFVGDIKQSIYRFRGARPDVFRDLRKKLPQAGQLSLTRCFRSQPAILDFVNTLFESVWGDDYEALEAVREQHSPTPAIEFLWTHVPKESGIKKKGDADRARKAEARVIAERLKELIENETPLIPKQTPADESADALRPIKPGDIAILFRALSNIAEYEAALQDAGLDYYLVGGHAFYAKQEVFDFVNLLSAIASEADNLALAGVLRSPFFSLADESLFWLMRLGATLNDGLMRMRPRDGNAPPSIMSEHESAKITRAAETLDALRGIKDHVSIAELIAAALRMTGYDATLCAEFLGERKLANLRKLQRLARAADRDGAIGLHGFIEQLNEFIARAPKEPPASTSAETADVIRLMSVHQAKGMEFPLVVLADIDRQERARSENVAFAPALGPLVKMKSDDDADAPFSGFEMRAFAEKPEEREEAARLFYVACTRAADYLILSASITDFEKPSGPWRNILQDRFNLENGQIVGEQLAGANRPNVRVTINVADSQKRAEPKRRGLSLKTVIARAEAAAPSAPRLPTLVTQIPVHARARRRFSFSQLTGALEETTSPEFDEAGAGPFLKTAANGNTAAPGADPLAIGRLAHKMLEFVLEDDAPKPRELAARLAPRFVDAFDSNLSGEAVDDACGMVERFLASKRASILCAAPSIQSELEFQTQWPPRAADPSDRFLHGYIDVLHQTPAGDWALLDYKTNQMRDDVAATAKKYELQQFVYASAIEAAIGAWPSEVVLHFLRTGEEYVFAWTADERETLTARVNQAMERVVASSNESSTTANARP